MAEADPPPPANSGANAPAPAEPAFDASAGGFDSVDPSAPGAPPIDEAALNQLLELANFDSQAEPATQAAATHADPTAPAPGAGAPPAAAALSPDFSTPDTVDASSFQLPDFQQVIADATASSIDLLRDVELNVKIELGRSRMLVEDVLKLAEGSVVELDKLAGDPVDVFVNERLVARGEVLVLNDSFCVRVNEVVATGREDVS